MSLKACPHLALGYSSGTQATRIRNSTVPIAHHGIL
jgi:hypothetical protein